MYEQTNDARIAQLHPLVAKMAREWLRRVTAEGIAVCVVQGLRTFAEQDELYAQGRTKPGNIVTQVRGGYSYHNYGLAFDFCLVKPDGSLDWDVGPKWRRAAEIGKSLRFSWGGDWDPSFQDFPHFEYTFGLTTQQLKAGAVPGEKEEINVPTIVKERIYAQGGKLVRCDGDYSKAASDVRYIKFAKGQARLKFAARKGATVSQLLAESSADFATNGPYFWDGTPLGNVVADGKLLYQAYGKMLKWHELGTTADGSYTIGQLDPGAWDMMVQGAPLLIDNGNLCWDYFRVQEEVPDDIGKSNAQRTVYGIDAEGALHIAVADGRTKWDKGPTLEEMALYMQAKGCTYALNLDGGSSSVIAEKGKGSLGQNQGAQERAVNHAILIYLKAADPAPTPAPAPAEKGWKEQGVDWLLLNGGITSEHEPTEAVDIGTLGTILKNLKGAGN